MLPFAYARPSDERQAMNAGVDTGQGEVDAPTQFLAGGTTLIDLMKIDVLRPRKVVDIGALAERYGHIEARPDGLRLGAFVTMEQAADDPIIQRDYPAIAQSLSLAASAQLRNMASLGGNVLQRTRCLYYRDVRWTACNKRSPGSGCAAIGGVTRNHAVLGVDETCIAQYPGDFAVSLIALGAEVEAIGPGGPRVFGFETLHRPVGDGPEREHTLLPGEIIVGFRVPAGGWTRRSTYVKVRDRQSYEFAIASAAVALDMDGGVVRRARIGLGGVAYRPWRAHEAETMLAGKPMTQANAEAAGRSAFARAVVHGENAYKPELGRRTLTRALMAAAAMEV
jgi:xanthine dehydrogenase YagS FAD-binding subunit